LGRFLAAALALSAPGRPVAIALAIGVLTFAVGILAVLAVAFLPVLLLDGTPKLFLGHAAVLAVGVITLAVHVVAVLAVAVRVDLVAGVFRHFLGRRHVSCALDGNGFLLVLAKLAFAALTLAFLLFAVGFFPVLAFAIGV